MFNALGERNVTTNHIADELGISAGNLYYHFRSKDDIVAQLYTTYEARVDEALNAPSKHSPTLEDFSLLSMRMLECAFTFRFFHRDLTDILSRNRKLKQRFARMLHRVDEHVVALLRDFVDAEILVATKQEIRSIAENFLLTTTFWLNYQSVRYAKTQPAQPEFAHGVDQIMALIAPFSRERR